MGDMGPCKMCDEPARINGHCVEHYFSEKKKRQKPKVDKEVGLGYDWKTLRPGEEPF